MLSILNVNFIRANSKQGTRVPDPVFIERPDGLRTTTSSSTSSSEHHPAGRRLASKDEVRRFFGGNVRYTPRSSPEES